MNLEIKKPQAPIKIYPIEGNTEVWFSIQKLDRKQEARIQDKLYLVKGGSTDGDMGIAMSSFQFNTVCGSLEGWGGLVDESGERIKWTGRIADVERVVAQLPDDVFNFIHEEIEVLSGRVKREDVDADRQKAKSSEVKEEEEEEKVKEEKTEE